MRAEFTPLKKFGDTGMLANSVEPDCIGIDESRMKAVARVTGFKGIALETEWQPLCSPPQVGASKDAILPGRACVPLMEVEDGYYGLRVDLNRVLREAKFEDLPKDADPIRYQKAFAWTLHGVLAEGLRDIPLPPRHVPGARLAFPRVQLLTRLGHLAAVLPAPRRR